jgi:hypothetical protein
MGMLMGEEEIYICVEGWEQRTEHSYPSGRPPSLKKWRGEKHRAELIKISVFIATMCLSRSIINFLWRGGDLMALPVFI